MKKSRKIVCLGGGIGTVNLIKDLKEYDCSISVVVSMADDGGSAGRLRRFYSVPPPGDLVSCTAAMSNADPLMQKLLTYRFTGNRYGSDHSLPGHKLGNLILVALTSITGNFNTALLEMQRIFKAKGSILPSTIENISIWAETSSGDKVYGEENIDLGRFKGCIERLYLKPSNPKMPEEVKEVIEKANVIVAGPGDLYTTTLPVLMVPDIADLIVKSEAQKFFVVNIANKPFETKDYKVSNYVKAIEKHLKAFPFQVIIANNNLSQVIPNKYDYEYVENDIESSSKIKVIADDLVDINFPIYHDSNKLAKIVYKAI